MISMRRNVDMGHSSPEISLPLRERVRKSMGTGIQVSWSSLPEVKSSGLLDTLPENQLSLEELKFCLITCEVAYNIELVELVNLSKKSVGWADPLPAFNRRTIASTIERVKRCSDGVLNAFEKHWNTKPVVNMAMLNKILSDMVLQFQIYVTYCTHQEDFRTVLRNAMRSKYEVVAASFSDRLNVERVMLPLQHLKLYRLLLQDIRSILMTTTNRLENFHCKRTLTDITKLLEECYKILATLHGSQYVTKLDTLLEESVHGFDPGPTRNITEVTRYQESYSVCSLESSDSVDNKNSNVESDCVWTSKEKRFQAVIKSESSSVKERCKFFNLQAIEVNCKDIIKSCDNRNSALKRQKPIEVCRRKVIDVAMKRNSSPFINERLAELEELNNNMYKGNYYPARSKYSFLDFPNIFKNTTMSGRQRYFSVYETVYGSVDNEGSKKHIAWLKNKLKLSSNENISKPSHLTSSNNTDSLSLHTNLAKNMTRMNHKPAYTKESHINQENSVHDKWKIENLKNSHLSETSVLENQRVQTNVQQSNECQKLPISSTTCDAGKQLGTGPLLNIVQSPPTSPQSPPLKIQCRGVGLHPLNNDTRTNQVQTNNDSCSEKIKQEIQFTTSTEEGPFSYNFPSVGNSDSSCYEDVCNSTTSKTKSSSEIEKVSNKREGTEVSSTSSNHQSEKKGQPLFISSYDLGCPVTPSEPQSSETELIYNDYKPMNESFRRNFNQPKPKSPSKSLQRKVVNGNGTIDSEMLNFSMEHSSMLNVSNSYSSSAYEEYKPSVPDTSAVAMDADISSSSLLSTYDVPLYQAYNFGSVQHSSTKVEEDIYIEPDEHIYEEINFYEEAKPQHNASENSGSGMKISKPSGTSQRVRWSDISEVISTGLLETLDTGEITLQEAKYEVITSEASYYKSLVILDTVFISSPELTDRNILSEEDHIILFTSVKKVKQCTEKFLVELVDGWQDDLMLGYLCHAVCKFVASGAFKVYVDCCANQIYVDKTLQHLKLTNPEFTSVLSHLEQDPVCQMFTLQSFLTLPMQRVTRLPLLVQAILRRLPSDHSEYSTWNEALVKLQKIVNECNEATGRAEKMTTLNGGQHMQPNNKTLTMTSKQLSQEKKKQSTIWNIFKTRKQTMEK